jgi:Tfp pilus assembly protein PilF
LGRVAHEQQAWAEAERCYREGLMIQERLGSLVDAATSCNDLGIVAQLAGHPAEAEVWYKRAVELDEQVEPESLAHASHLHNLAVLLYAEVSTGRMPRARLDEARSYAERTQRIREQPGVSTEIWNSFET